MAARPMKSWSNFTADRLGYLKGARATQLQQELTGHPLADRVVVTRQKPVGRDSAL